ncbi:hypothetical protein AAG906_007278 [Vitis piasezkii]|uniref:Two-pore potassium channel 3 n=1 Tax=Vitis vinifera TaxID=29760 RepID=A0A438IPH2_VITVI|nr:Two-pore potassium channel 3 [Vitis vinifera]
MDEALLSRQAVVGESSRPSPRREFASSILDPGSHWRQSTARITTTTPTSFFVDLISNLNRKRNLPRRSHSAPSVFTDAKEDPRPSQKSMPLIVRQAFIWVILYCIVGIVIICLKSGSFKGHLTVKPVDALYFSVVTLCTIGYGDIVPDTTFTKMFTCVFILVGFGFIHILLNGLLTYVLDRQEAVMMSTVDLNQCHTMIQTYMIDPEKGRIRIRIKVVLALAVVIVCIAVGTIGIHLLEDLTWVDSVYLSVTSVTTVGYGDYAFETLAGRCFAIIWLLVSTLAVARAFLYLTELSIDRRNRRIAKSVLEKLILAGLVAAEP